MKRDRRSTGFTQKSSLALALFICLYFLSLPTWAEGPTTTELSPSEVRLVGLTLEHLEGKVRKFRPQAELRLQKESFFEPVPLRFRSDDFAAWEDQVGCSSKELADLLSASQNAHPQTWQGSDMIDVRPTAADGTLKVWLSPPLLLARLPDRRYVLYLVSGEIGLLVLDLSPSESIQFDLPIAHLDAH